MESSPRLVNIRSRPIKSETVGLRAANNGSAIDAAAYSNPKSFPRVTLRKERSSPRTASVINTANQIIEPDLAPKYKIKARNKSGVADIVDRRIQDLEISNKSLLSINSYLEKKLRRQEQELNNIRCQQGPEPIKWTSIDQFSSDDEELDDEPIDEIDKQARRKTLIHIEERQKAQETDRVLHKCIYVTEQLLKDAQEAMNYEVHDDEIKLGGKIVHEDDIAQGLG